MDTGGGQTAGVGGKWFRVGEQHHVGQIGGIGPRLVMVVMDLLEYLLGHNLRLLMGRERRTVLDEAGTWGGRCSRTGRNKLYWRRQDS